VIYRITRRPHRHWRRSCGGWPGDDFAAVGQRDGFLFAPKLYLPFVGDLRTVSEPSARDTPGLEKPIQAILAYEIATFGLSVFEAEQ